MKKFLIIIFILFLSTNICFANGIKISEYLDKEYIGIPYEEALKKTKPLILVFADSRDFLSIIKMAPIAEMVYNNFNGKYNFCILNTKIKSNKKLFKAYGIDEKLPLLLVINTQTESYYLINSKYYNKTDLQEILEYIYKKISSSYIQ